jgi:hypothetical protein
LGIYKREFSMGEYDKRKYIRYPADQNELVTIHYLDESTKKTGQRVGHSKNESFNGCCVVFVGNVSFKKGQEVLCESSTLCKVRAKVAWVRNLEEEIIKAGFSFIE